MNVALQYTIILVGSILVGGLVGGAMASLYWLWRSAEARGEAALLAAQKLGLQHEPSHASPILALVPRTLKESNAKIDLPFAIDDAPKPVSPDGLELDYMVEKIMKDQGIPEEDAREQAEQMLRDFRAEGTPSV